MAPALTLMPLTLSAPLPLEKVELRLAAPDLTPDTGAPVSLAARIFTLNLICRVEPGAAGEAAVAQLLELAPRHPARIFLLVAGGADEASGFEARVAPRAGADYRSEVVRLGVARSRLAAAASLVAPLLMGDLPVVLWWHGRPEGPDFEPVAALADRVLLDGGECGLSLPELVRIAGGLRTQSRMVVDLAWTRLTPWRQSLCQAAESDCADRLGQAARLRITASGRPSASLPAMLLAGWLSHQLHWQPQARVGERELDLKRAQGSTLRLEFAAAGDTADPRTPASVELLADGGSVLLALRPQPDADAQRNLLSQELSITGHDRVFEASLAAAAAICACLEANPA